MTRSEFVKRLLLAISIVLTVLLVIYAFQIFLLIFAGCLLSILLTGLAGYSQKYLKLSEELSLILILILIIVLIGSCTWLFGQQIGTQVDKLGNSLRSAYDSFLSQIQHTNWGSQFLKQAASGVSDSNGLKLLSKITDIFTTTANALFDMFVIVLLGLFLAFEHRLYTRGFKIIFPKEHREKVVDLFSHIGQALRWWMFGQFMYMLAIGVMSTIGLWIMGIPMALSLGILAMLLSFIPYLGTIMSAVPAMLIALTMSNQMALYVLILYVAIHMIDAYLLAPLIQLEAISLPPALTIAAQILMAFLAGGLGLVLATPLIAVVIVMIQILYIRNVLGENVMLIGQHHSKE